MKFVLLPLIVVALVASSCELLARPPQPSPTGAPTATPTAAPTRAGGLLRYGLAAEPCALDPWNVADPNALLVTRQIFETLVEYGDDLRVVPGLAAKWERSPDGRQWTFTLRDGVRFHDGAPLDAEAVVFSFERARLTAHPQRGAPRCERYSVFGDLFGGFDADSLVARVEALDPQRVRFTLKAPFAPFLASLAAPGFGIVSPKGVREDADAFGAPRGAPRLAAGTGPFLLKSWQPGVDIALQRNATYWRKDARGQELPYLDALVFRFLPDVDSRIRRLKSGDLDVIADFAPSEIPGVAADPNVRVERRPSMNVTYLGLNASAPPFDAPQVRRAIAMAVNKRPIADTLYGGFAKPASQFVPPGLPGHDDALREFAPYDQTQARRLLSEAGVPPGFETELWYPPVWRPSYPDPKRVAELFAADLARVGIDARLVTVDLTTFRKKVRENELPLWLGDLAADAADAHDFLCQAFCPSVVGGLDGPTPGGAWSSPIVWRLLRDAAAMADPAARAAIYQQVSKIVREEVPRIPLFHVERPIALTGKVSGYRPSAIGVESLAAVVVAR